MKKNLNLKLPDGQSVSGILQVPDDAWCILVFAHGAGAGMEHRFMQDAANRFEKSGIATLRFNFLFMENGGRPDPPAVAHRVLRAATEAAKEAVKKSGIPVIGGGKSFGGRMFSQLMSSKDAPDVAGLVFFGFPLHAPGKAGKERADHLAQVKVPMLFLQGTRDSLAQLDLITEVTKAHRKATLFVLDGGDHSFKVPKKSGLTESQVMDNLVSETVAWLKKNVVKE
jgi:predicted alpha/beta-hydrolase family hydrolase